MKNSFCFSSIDHFLEQKRFAVFCLARIGCEIIDTQLKFVDKQSNEILFTDQLTLWVKQTFSPIDDSFRSTEIFFQWKRSVRLWTRARDLCVQHQSFSFVIGERIRWTLQLFLHSRNAEIVSKSETKSEQWGSYSFFARFVFVRQDYIDLKHHAFASFHDNDRRKRSFSFYKSCWQSVIEDYQHFHYRSEISEFTDKNRESSSRYKISSHCE